MTVTEKSKIKLAGIQEWNLSRASVSEADVEDETLGMEDGTPDKECPFCLPVKVAISRPEHLKC